MTPYTYWATVVSVHDGDTFTASLDLGFDLSFRTAVRLSRCNARELSMPGGREARDNLAAVLAAAPAITLTSTTWDKFGGRIDADVELVHRDEAQDLVGKLVATGWAAPWDGKGTRPLPPWPREGNT